MIRNIISSILFFAALPIQLLFPSKLKIDKLEIHVPECNQSLHNDVIRIVLLSDVHWDPTPGRRITNELFDEVVEAVNGLSPDIIMITGDFVEYFPSSIDVLAHQFLVKLKSKHGIYAVLGNHDYKFDYDQNKKLMKELRAKGVTNLHPHMKLDGAQIIKDVLKSIGVKVLTNEKDYPFPDNKDFEIIGLGDMSSPEFLPEKVLTPTTTIHNNNNGTKESHNNNKISIVMSHNPDTASNLSKYDYTLQLSGHTHGGQIRFPNGQPLIPAIRGFIQWIVPEFLQRKLIPRPIRHILFGVVKNWKWASGLHAIPRKSLNGNNLLYISRGLATHPPLRLFCDPEVTVIDFVKTCPDNSATVVTEIKENGITARLFP